MILIIAPAFCGAECAKTLQKVTGRNVQAISDLRLASRLLHNSEFSVIVIDHNLAESQRVGCESLLNRAGSAFPVFVNFAVSGIDRVVREVQAAQRRRHSERLTATKAVLSELRNELVNAVTGILISSELALAVPSLPVAAATKMKYVHELAAGIRKQLEPHE